MKNSKVKNIQLVESESSTEDAIDNSNSKPETRNDIGERLGTLQEKVMNLENKKFIEVNLENTLIAGLVAAVVGIAIWVLFDKYNSINIEIDKLECKNNRMVECYQDKKCDFRQLIQKQYICDESIK
jgi:hypothetical protein